MIGEDNVLGCVVVRVFDSDCELEADSVLVSLTRCRVDVKVALGFVSVSDLEPDSSSVKDRVLVHLVLVRFVNEVDGLRLNDSSSLADGLSLSVGALPDREMVAVMESEIVGSFEAVLDLESEISAVLDLDIDEVNDIEVDMVPMETLKDPEKESDKETVLTEMEPVFDLDRSDDKERDIDPLVDVRLSDLDADCSSVGVPLTVRTIDLLSVSSWLLERVRFRDRVLVCRVVKESDGVDENSSVSEADIELLPFDREKVAVVDGGVFDLVCVAFEADLLRDNSSERDSDGVCLVELIDMESVNEGSSLKDTVGSDTLLDGVALVKDAVRVFPWLLVMESEVDKVGGDLERDSSSVRLRLADGKVADVDCPRVRVNPFEVVGVLDMEYELVKEKVLDNLELVRESSSVCERLVDSDPVCVMVPERLPDNVRGLVCVGGT